MVFREIVAIFTENCMKHINTVYGQIAALLDAKAGSTYGNHCPTKQSFSNCLCLVHPETLKQIPGPHKKKKLRKCTA
jgi:hypothetical protein